MENCVTDYLLKRGYRVNTTALELIHACDDWYANRKIPEFHHRNTVQNVPYDLKQLNLAKRCCSDDANLCEILDVNAGSTEQQKDFVNAILADSEFQTQYRKQLEKVSADGTAACYVRLDDATIMKSGRVQGGRIRLNYVEAESYIPLTVENDVVTEAAFSGTGLEKGKKQTTLVIFTKDQAGNYTAETAVFDEYGAKIEDKSIVLGLGDMKPFAVLQNAEVNNLDDMVGYGLPKLHNAIPALEVVELAFNVLYGDLDKADKLILINEMLCQFDGSGKPITPNEQAKKLFVLLGERLPTQKELIQEYNPEMIIVAPQLNDWGETSARQTIALTEYFLSAYNIDKSKVYAEGYSGGGETMSLVMGMRPDLYTAYLQCSSQWDGAYEPVVQAKTPVYFVVGAHDEYYGSEPSEDAYNNLRELYQKEGLSDEEIDDLLVLDVKDDSYFSDQGVTNQHGQGGGLFVEDDAVMGWLLGK